MFIFPIILHLLIVTAGGCMGLYVMKLALALPEDTLPEPVQLPGRIGFSLPIAGVIVGLARYLADMLLEHRLLGLPYAIWLAVACPIVVTGCALAGFFIFRRTRKWGLGLILGLSFGIGIGAMLDVHM